MQVMMWRNICLLVPCFFFFMRTLWLTGGEHTLKKQYSQTSTLGRREHAQEAIKPIKHSALRTVVASYRKKEHNNYHVLPCWPVAVKKLPWRPVTVLCCGAQLPYGVCRGDPPPNNDCFVPWNVVSTVILNDIEKRFRGQSWRFQPSLFSFHP